MAETVNKIVSDDTVSDILKKYLHDGVLFIGENGRILTISDKAKEILGISDADLDKPIASILFNDERNDSFAETLVSTIREKNQLKNTIQDYYIGDIRRTLMVTARCIEYENDTRMLIIFTDITDFLELRDTKATLEKIRHLNEKLEEAKNEADEANKAKSHFLSNMSHEIRTPINAILGMNEMILRECEDSQILSYAKSVEESGKTLLALINDILDLSKIESGKMDIVTTEYSLLSAFRELYNMSSFRAKDKGLELEFVIDENIPANLSGDEVRIKQIIMNILTNAVKYTPSGKVTLTAGFVSIDEDLIKLIVSVKDTGIGIKEEDLGKLFASFERIEEKRNLNIEGTGLGMSIALALLNSMNGTIKVKSEYGKGSEFTVEIPQEVLEKNPIGKWNQEIAEIIPKDKKRKCFIAPEVKILVVDDNPMNLMVVKNLLKRTQINITTVDSGIKCHEMIVQEKYDMIFMDHMMPEMDGIETYLLFNEIPYNKNLDTPVIMLTANAINGVKEQYLSAGFKDYLSKPIDMDIMEKMLCEYIDTSKIQEITEEEKMQYSGKGKDKKYSSVVEKMIAIRLEYYNRKYSIDIKAGLDLQKNDFDFYLELLSNFSRLSEERRMQLNSFYEKNDLAAYAILTHAIKGDVRMLGAVEFGEIAFAHEMAGKEGNIEFIHNNFDEFMDNFEKTLSGFKEMLAEWQLDYKENDAISDLAEIESDEIMLRLKEIIELIDEFEDDKAVEIIHKLLNCKLKEEHADKLKDALTAIEKDYDSDKAAEIIGGLIK